MGASSRRSSRGLYRAAEWQDSSQPHTQRHFTDTDDLAFFQARFRDPHHVALLVRPFATKASTAGSSSGKTAR
jgi:hypothetical protein